MGHGASPSKVWASLPMIETLPVYLISQSAWTTLKCRQVAKGRGKQNARLEFFCTLEILSSMHQRCSYPTVMASYHTPQPPGLEGRRSTSAKGCSRDGYLHSDYYSFGEDGAAVSATQIGSAWLLSHWLIAVI